MCRLIHRQHDDLQPVTDRFYFQRYIAAGLQIGVGGDLQETLICLDGDQSILVAALNRAAQDGAVIKRSKVTRRVRNSAGDCDGAQGAWGTG